MTNTLASEVREFDFSNERLDKMRDTFESSKEVIEEAITNFFEQFVSVFYEDKNWSWHGCADASRFVASFQYHLDRCIETHDKTKDKIAKLISEDNQTEIDINQSNKLTFASKAQELNIERAQYLLDVAKEQYKKIIGKDWTPTNNKKVKSDIKKSAESQAFLKNALKQGTLI